MHLRDKCDVGEGGRPSGNTWREAHATQSAWPDVGGVTTSTMFTVTKSSRHLKVMVTETREETTCVVI